MAYKLINVIKQHLVDNENTIIAYYDTDSQKDSLSRYCRDNSLHHKGYPYNGEGGEIEPFDRLVIYTDWGSIPVILEDINERFVGKDKILILDTLSSQYTDVEQMRRWSETYSIVILTEESCVMPLPIKEEKVIPHTATKTEEYLHNYTPKVTVNIGGVITTMLDLYIRLSLWAITRIHASTVFVLENDKNVYLKRPDGTADGMVKWGRALHNLFHFDPELDLITLNTDVLRYTDGSDCKVDDALVVPAYPENMLTYNEDYLTTANRYRCEKDVYKFLTVKIPSLNFDRLESLYGGLQTLDGLLLEECKKRYPELKDDDMTFVNINSQHIVSTTERVFNRGIVVDRQINDMSIVLYPSLDYIGEFIVTLFFDEELTTAEFPSHLKLTHPKKEM